MFQPAPIALLIVAIYFISSIKILAEYERAVIFRLGRVLPNPKGPGLILVFRPIDRMVRISLRLETLEVPAQDVVTRDNVTLKVNAAVFFRVLDAKGTSVKEGRAGMLDASVPPGEHYEVTMIVPLLPAGSYWLMVDMVEEGHVWLSQLGAEPWEEEFVVRE